MYKSFYKLDKKPFETKTDPAFLWHGEKHREALATLRYGILNNMGFLLLTGDVGTGKTTLINALTDDLPPGVIHIYISDPNLEPLDFYNYIAFSLNFKIEINTKSSFLIIFKKFLLKAAQANRKILLIIDEAQLLSDELLEQTRLLSNIDRSSTNILNIFFIGQPEFNHTLLKEKNRAVRQRISLNYDIKPFKPEETREYINYRLKISGAQYDIFSSSAIKKIHSASGGFPRRINIICDHCLLSGFVKDKTIITKKIASECIRDLTLPDESGSSGKSFNTIHRREKRFKNILLHSAAAVLFFVLFFFVYINFETFNNVFLRIKELSKTQITDKGINAQINQQEQKAEILPEKINIKQTETAAVSQETQNVVNHEAQQETDLEPEKDEIINEDIIQEKPAAENEVIEQEAEELPVPELPPFEEKTFIIRFKYNTNEFEDSELSKIEECANILKKYPNSKAVITGYTDSEGYPQYNLKLSEFRANIVKGYLIGKGLSPEKIDSKGKGDKNPIEENTTSWGRKMNRRVEILVYQNSK
ncbi:MAG: AAA family ATPase [Desulfobacteraceae bacterium]|nr:AAA family ATPase [Desulfobacteraceae bacterium]